MYGLFYGVAIGSYSCRSESLGYANSTVGYTLISAAAFARRMCIVAEADGALEDQCSGVGPPSPRAGGGALGLRI